MAVQNRNSERLGLPYLLEEVSNALPLREAKAQALKEGQHLIDWPMENDVTWRLHTVTALFRLLHFNIARQHGSRSQAQ